MPNALIEFEAVSLRYPKGRDIVLSNISFRIEEGSRVGLVGRSGSGKSSLMKLMLELYLPTEGEIRINGQSIESLNPADYISTIPQSTSIFCGRSVRENLIFNDEDPEEMYRIATELNMHDVIMGLPNGYDTLMNESMLSGGQMQRFIFIRGLLKKAPILIVDEGTSNQDPKNEELIKRALQKSKQTIIIIAHHSSTLRDVVDRVIVLEDGKIAQDGSFDEVSRAGAYASLFTQ